MYYAAIDVTTECIRTRFNQKDFKVYQSIQELLLKAVAGEDHDEELANVFAVYGDTDLQQYKLEVQLSLLPEVVHAMGYDTSRFDIADLLDFFQSLENAHKLLLSEICTLGKLMLVMPATNAVSERSFSALTQTNKRAQGFRKIQSCCHKIRIFDGCFVSNISRATAKKRNTQKYGHRRQKKKTR